MKRSKKKFQQHLLQVIVGSIIAAVIGGLINNFLSTEQPKIISREITINRNVDGSTNERKLELYK